MSRTTKSSAFVNASGEVIATGTIKLNFIDLHLADGTRFYSTRSDGFALEFLQSLNIKGEK